MRTGKKSGPGKTSRPRRGWLVGQDHVRRTWFFLLALGIATLWGCTPPPTPSPVADPTALPAASFAVPTSLVAAPEIGPLERWIEVDLRPQRVRLREGNRILAEHAASTGVAISDETTTWPGIYRVQQMIKGPIENVPGVFIADILIFDLAAGAGIHSMPMDQGGTVLDDTLGKAATAGCVRVTNSRLVFEFAQLGMTIWIH